MNIRFYPDPETLEPHIYKHGVAEADAEDVLHWPEEDQRGRQGTLVARGRSQSGMPLKVLYIQYEYGIMVITAYQMTGKELKAFRKRRKK